jgi:hypothetical protein
MDRTGTPTNPIILDDDDSVRVPVRDADEHRIAKRGRLESVAESESESESEDEWQCGGPCGLTSAEGVRPFAPGEDVCEDCKDSEAEEGDPETQLMDPEDEDSEDTC